MKNRIKIAIIGCGAHCRAMLDGMLSPASTAVLKNNGDIFDITVIDRDEANLMPVKTVCRVALDYSAAESCSYIILSADAVLPQIPRNIFKDKTLLSFIDVPISQLKELTGAERIVRATVDPNASIGEAITLYSGDGLDGECGRVVCEILGSMGMFIRVEERAVYVAAAAMNMGRALTAALVDSIVGEAESCGVSSSDALSLAVQSVYGSALAIEQKNGGARAFLSEERAAFDSHDSDTAAILDDAITQLRSAISAAVNLEKERSKE